jgi:hypothetical protein
MAVYRKEFGDDFTQTLYLAAILIWPFLTKKANNAFINKLIINLAENIIY